jgi:hypothetical protein
MIELGVNEFSVLYGVGVYLFSTSCTVTVCFGV